MSGLRQSKRECPGSVGYRTDTLSGTGIFKSASDRG
jgi:hypothetical protein